MGARAGTPGAARVVLPADAAAPPLPRSRVVAMILVGALALWLLLSLVAPWQAWRARKDE